jgi:hypothetical protein
MPTRSPTRTFSGQGLSPAIYPEFARTDAVKFAPGDYLAGTVVAQISTLTAANDVQTITVTGTPTGGSFRLALSGQVTGPIAYNANAAAVQAALEALSNVGTGNVVGGGGPLPGTAVTATFQGDVAGVEVPLITLYSNSLTGGATPTVTIAHTTPGRSAGGHWKPYNDANTDGSEVAKGIAQYAFSVDNYGRHTVGGGEYGEYTLSAPIYISGYFRTADLTGIDAAGVADLGKITHGAIGALTNTGTILRMPA